MFKGFIFLSLLAIAAEAACPPGYKGVDCKERDCPIVSFSGEGFDKTIYIDEKETEKAQLLNDIATECKVVINVTNSFTRLTNPNDVIIESDFHFLVGAGINFELNGNNKNCDEKCLASKQAPNSEFECFLKKVGKHHNTSVPGVFKSRSFSMKSKDDMNILKARQVGCELREDLPHIPASKLVGRWELVDSKNWDEFLNENRIGYWTKLVVRLLKPDIKIQNWGRKWQLNVKSTFKNLESKFTEGTRWSSKSPISGDRTLHDAYSETRDRLIEDQEIFSNPKRMVHIIREINDKGQMVQSLTLNKVTTVRTYRRMN